jgi:hypothetical protein
MIVRDALMHHPTTPHHMTTTATSATILQTPAVRLCSWSCSLLSVSTSAGVVANESMQRSHAPPKLSTQTRKTSNCDGFATVVKFATAVKFVTVTKHLEKAGVVANESTQCSHASAKHFTRYNHSHQQCNKVVAASRTDFCPHPPLAQRVINNGHSNCFTFW